MSTQITPKEAREAKRLTQIQLAGLAKISLGTIVRAERTGQWPKQHRTRKALMRALGVRAPKGARP